jgi:hypothetical protein
MEEDSEQNHQESEHRLPHRFNVNKFKWIVKTSTCSNDSSSISQAATNKINHRGTATTP